MKILRPIAQYGGKDEVSTRMSDPSRESVASYLYQSMLTAEHAIPVPASHYILRYPGGELGIPKEGGKPEVHCPEIRVVCRLNEHGLPVRDPLPLRFMLPSRTHSTVEFMLTNAPFR